MFAIMKYVGLILAILFFVLAIIFFFAQKTFEAFKYFADNKERLDYMDDAGKKRKKRAKTQKKQNVKAQKTGDLLTTADVIGVDPDADTDVLGSVESYVEMLADANSTTVVLPEI